MATINPTEQTRLYTLHTQAIATNTKLVTKCKKKHKHHKIQLCEQNCLVEELDVTTTSQANTIATLMDKIRDLESKVTRTGSLESRIYILESLQADNIPQTLPSHVDTTSTTQKSTSSIHSSQHETITSNLTSKRQKTGNKDHSRSHTNPS